MKYFTHTELATMLRHGSTRVIENKEAINAINLFPVPDSDTGSNLANTFTAIQHVLRNPPEDAKLIPAILDAGLTASQGNSGIIMISFLSGFLNIFLDKKEYTIHDLAIAAQKGTENAQRSIENPIKGTILDAMIAFATILQKQINENISLADAFLQAIEQTKKALVNTEKEMKLLETNHVVDAGAFGFTLFVYGMYEGLTGKHIELSNIDKIPVQKTGTATRDVGAYPFEVVFTVQDTTFTIEQLRKMFHPMGDCLDIVSIENKTKIHIHTDTPEVVQETAILTGEILNINTVDMRINKIEHKH